MGLALVIALAACEVGQPENDASNEFNNIMAESAAEKAWHYSRNVDRIRNSETVMASLYSVEGETATGTRAVLSVQGNPNGSTDVFFRAHTVNCHGLCSVAYRSGAETGLWAASGEPGLIILAEFENATELIKRSRTLIAELDGSQYTFNTAGLEWPPRQRD
jgi:hypothetical protein